MDIDSAMNMDSVGSGSNTASLTSAESQSSLPPDREEASSVQGIALKKYGESPGNSRNDQIHHLDQGRFEPTTAIPRPSVQPLHSSSLFRNSSSSSVPLLLPQQSSNQQDELVPMLYVTHKMKVHAVHKLWNSAASEVHNVERFGQATQIHGHTYTFSVLFKGGVCKQRSEIVGSSLLEDVCIMAIAEVLDRKNLDVDIGFFHNKPSTTENLCLFVWRNLAIVMKPHPFQVEELKIKVDPCPKFQGLASTTGTSGSSGGIEGRHSHGLVDGVYRTVVSYRGESTTLPM